MTPSPATTEIGNRVRWVIILALLYCACLVTLGPTVQFSQWYIGPDNNQAAAEAEAWLDGRLTLPGRGGDTALYNGQVYNIFPPLLTVICFVYYGATSWLNDGMPLVFFTPLYVLIVAAPIPLLAYYAFRRSGADTHWAAVLAFYAIAGTCLWPVAGMLGGNAAMVGDNRAAWIYSIQHILAQTGLAIILIDLLGRRRMWLAGLGLLIATWSRQTCFLYCLPILWIAWNQPQRRRALILAAIPIAITIALPAGLNWAKFGNPLETGYRHIFDVDNPNRRIVLGADGDVHLFGLGHVPGHAKEMFLVPPQIFTTHQGLRITGWGPRTALWYGSPLFLFALIDARRWWRDSVRRVLMLATIPVIFVGLMWHGPIEGSSGYYRYTLDYSLIWMAAITPWTTGPTRRWIVLACLAWSVFYFYSISGNP
jgi:hypothetical protein